MDARSLLRAKKAESRIDHPFAAYNASGVLRCSICAIPVKQWDAHLLTKAHRISVAREKASLEKVKGKRPADEREMDGEGSRSGSGSVKKSRIEATANENENEDEDGDEGEGVGAQPAGLPAGFFSSGNRLPTPPPEIPLAISSKASIPTPAPQPVKAETGDAELDDFLASLSDPTQPEPIEPIEPNQPIAGASIRRNIPSYKTAIAGVASYEAAPVRIDPSGEVAEEEKEVEAEETEHERREREARDDREEIMGRLEEEERAQEDADSRVTLLKARMEMLKKRREARGPPVGKAKASSVTMTNGA